MNILFVENRYKTVFWEVVAKELEQDGHIIFWIVQNHAFSPKNLKNIFVLPYPKRLSHVAAKDYTEGIRKIIKADRGLNYFGIKSDNHFFYYCNEIKKVFSIVKPDVVFGEATLMHELLASEYCKQNNIPYLHPTSVRYPVDRFAFYKNDTLVPFGGSNEILRDNDCIDMINSIVNRTVQPYYMESTKMSFWERLHDKFVISTNYLRGERFNTPSPFRKLYLMLVLNKITNQCERIALDAIIEDDKFKILFPLHMQPESSVDVFATEFSNQVELIKKIADSLGENEIIYVKPNPKPAQEYTDKLVTLTTKHPRIKFLKQSTRMKDIFSKVDLIVTIAGTVAMETILANKPVGVFCDGLLFESKNCIRLYKASDVTNVINLIKEKKFPILENVEKIAYVNAINKSSYKGFIGDGWEGSIHMNQNNVNNIVNGFKSVLSLITEAKQKGKINS